MAREPRGVREYSTDEIVVEWQPRLCFHSHNCIRALPKVFDAERRPWVDLDQASADEVEAAVAQCPSGALRTRRPGAAETTDRAARGEGLRRRAAARSAAACACSTPRATCSTRATRRRSAAAAARPTSPSATARTRRTASRADADALPGRVVPVLLGRARGADRARDRLRRAAGRALARAARRPARAVGQRPDARARDRGRPLLPRHAGDLRLPAGRRSRGSTPRPIAAASSTTATRASPTRPAGWSSTSARARRRSRRRSRPS